MSGAVRHPSTTKMFKAAAERWRRLKAEHQTASDLMWLGALASNFTTAELALLSDFLSPSDRALLRGIERTGKDGA